MNNFISDWSVSTFCTDESSTCYSTKGQKVKQPEKWTAEGQQRFVKERVMTNHLPHVSLHGCACVCVCLWVSVCVKRERARQCVCVCDRRGWQSEGSANGRAHASAGPGLWLLISMCHSVPFPTHLAAQINPVHTEWRKPATETRVWCDTHGTSREKKKTTYSGTWHRLMPPHVHLSFPSAFFFFDSGKPKAACIAQWGTSIGLRSRAVWLLLKE